METSQSIGKTQDIYLNFLQRCIPTFTLPYISIARKVQTAVGKQKV